MLLGLHYCVIKYNTRATRVRIVFYDPVWRVYPHATVWKKHYALELELLSLLVEERLSQTP